MSSSQWPKDFSPIPNDDWTRTQIGELAEKYDTVEEHGWYDNLNPSVDQIAQHHSAEDIILDYSGGTGILTDRVFRALQDRSPHILIADSSPKFFYDWLLKNRNNPKSLLRLFNIFVQNEDYKSQNVLMHRFGSEVSMESFPPMPFTYITVWNKPSKTGTLYLETMVEYMYNLAILEIPMLLLDLGLLMKQ